jgi:hypothetical protein
MSQETLEPKKADQVLTLHLVLSSTGFGILLLLIANTGRLEPLLNPWMVLFVGLAAYRGGRAIAYNYIFSWLREPFTEVVDDSSGAGKSIEARGRGIRRALGELLCCPICSATWVALALTGLLVLAYQLGLVATFVLAASGVGEIFHWLSEQLEWRGRAAREEAGTAWLWKNKRIRPDAGDEGRDKSL